MEVETESINTKSDVDHSIPSVEKGNDPISAEAPEFENVLSENIPGEEITKEGNDLEDVRVTEDNHPNIGCVSDTASRSCFEDNHSEEGEPDEGVTKVSSLLENNQHLLSNDLPATTEDILLGFYESFRKTSHQLKKNDAILLKLFKEQNEILKTQTALMEKLMKKD